MEPLTPTPSWVSELKDALPRTNADALARLTELMGEPAEPGSVPSPPEDAKPT